MAPRYGRLTCPKPGVEPRCPHCLELVAQGPVFLGESDLPPWTHLLCERRVVRVGRRDTWQVAEAAFQGVTDLRFFF